MRQGSPTVPKQSRAWANIRAAGGGIAGTSAENTCLTDFRKAGYIPPPTMHFRAHTLSDDRRRRLLNEEVAAEGATTRRRSAGVRSDDSAKEADSSATTSALECPPQRSPRYTQAALMENQPRITDFIPRRSTTLLVLLAINLSVIGGLEWLYFKMPDWTKHTTDGVVAAFDLDSEGSLGAWYSSTILAVAAAYCFLIYSLRRHRIDDYRGRYRTWFAAGLCIAVMSIDESASLHEGFKEMMTLYTGQRLFGDGSVWWVAAYGLVLGWIGVRLLLDLRECWSALLVFFAAGASLAVAVLTQLELILPESGAVGVMLEEGLEMLGFVLVWLGCVLYARYVVRDIEGLIPPRKQKNSSSAADDPPRKRRRRASAETADEVSDATPRKPRKSARSQPVSAEARSSSSPPTKSSPSASTATKSSAAGNVTPAANRSLGQGASQPSAATALQDKRIDPAEEPGGPKLSKAERRAMRKERRKQR